MKLARPAVGIALCLASGTTTASGYLRFGFSSSDVAQSSCNELKDKDACFESFDSSTGEACSWCVAGAVPSECVSQEQAERLPPAVFECHIPSAQNIAEEEDGEEEDDGAVSFRFTDRKTHRLRAKHTASDICDPSSKSISGYMDISGSQYDRDGENKHLFFWMFEKRGSDATVDNDIPFIVWLTGGPGCSSTLALLTENGPCSVNKDGMSTTVNPYSWTEAAHVLWLDQPAGVGFSYGEENDSNEKMVAEDAYYFLQAFFQTYSEYASSPLYIVGESYGGHYAPAIAHRVWKGNKHLVDNTIALNLAGLGVGNGLTKPEEQYKWYPEMGHNNSHGIEVFDDTAYESMKAIVPRCTNLIAQCNKGDSVINEFACQSAFLLCNAGLTSPYQATGLNPYDIRIKCAVPPLCYDFSYVSKWLNLKSTKEALNVDPKHSHSWESCNFGINMKFHSDWMHNFDGFVADLLDDGIPALIYAGDVDFICNYLGNQAWTYNLEWSGKEAFQAATVHDWNGGSALSRTAEGLTFLQVHDAGHMVPSDKPEVALDMISNFVEGGSF